MKATGKRQIVVILTIAVAVLSGYGECYLGMARGLSVTVVLKRDVWNRFLSITETIATLPGGWDLAHAIRLGIKPFAELGANSEALSGSQVDSPCSCRAIFESAPVAMLQSPITKLILPDRWSLLSLEYSTQVAFLVYWERVVKIP